MIDSGSKPLSASSDSPTIPTAALDAYGWSTAWTRRLDALRAELGATDRDLYPVRVVFAARELYRVVGAHGEVPAVPAGRLRLDADATDSGSGPLDGGLFAVGDWAVSDTPPSGDGSPVRLVGRLPRTGRLARKVPGERTRVQVVGANLDTVFIVMGLDGDYNPRRLERFVAMAAEGEVTPVVVLTKADLRRVLAAESDDEPVEDVDALRWRAQDVAPGVPVFAVATPLAEGLEPLRAYLEPGRTIALVGSSGAGKSTLVNALCEAQGGEPLMRTGAVRASDDRGRHTTTHRQLLRLPGGALLIDNPGIRELQLWTDDGDAGLSSAFDELEALAASCRFSDCRHVDEPGCAVLAAVDAGTLPGDRLDAWHKLQRELEHLELRRDDAERRRRERGFGKMAREAQTMKRRSRR